MYNADIKTKFVKGYTTNISRVKACEYIFNRFEPYENNWGADLCTRTAEELQPVIDKLVGLRDKSNWLLIHTLKDYVKWCIDIEHIPCACDGMLNINEIGFDKMKTQTVASPLHLQKFLNEVLRSESEMFVDDIYRCACWLAYGGVEEEDLLQIKCSDVDLENKIVHYRGTEIPIYDVAIRAFKNCSQLTHFAFDNGHYSILRARTDGDTLIRGIRPTLTTHHIRTALSKMSKSDKNKTGIRLCYSRIWLSGLFYRTYEKEASGEEYSFDTVVSQKTEGKTYKLDSGRNTFEAKKRQLEKEYKTDYERWKSAYGL